MTHRICNALAAAILVVSAALAHAGDPPTVGGPAPGFVEPDSAGRTVSLAQFKGRTVVLEWTNPECPFVAKHYTSGNMQALQREATAAGVVWLTVSSAQPGHVGYLDELEAADLIEQRKAAPTHFVLDRDGKLMAAYGVSVALTMAVIDPQGALAYYGAIDDKPTAKPEDVTGAHNYVRAALAAVAGGAKPKPAQVRPYGCVAR